MVDGTLGKEVRFHWRGAGSVIQAMLSRSPSLSPSVLEIPDQSLGQRRWRPRIPFGLAVLGAGLWQAGLSLRSVFSVNLSTKASDSTAGEPSRDAGKTASSRLSAPPPPVDYPQCPCARVNPDTKHGSEFLQHDESLCCSAVVFRHVWDTVVTAAMLAGNT